MKLLTLKEAREQLRIGDSKIRMLIKAGKLRAAKVDGHDWRIDQRDLDAYWDHLRAKFFKPTVEASVQAAFDADEACGPTETRFP